MLPPDRYQAGKLALDKILDVESKLAALLSKNDLKELQKLLDENQDILDNEQSGYQLDNSSKTHNNH